jgi:hypothetical protein
MVKLRLPYKSNRESLLDQHVGAAQFLCQSTLETLGTMERWKPKIIIFLSVCRFEAQFLPIVIHAASDHLLRNADV